MSYLEKRHAELTEQLDSMQLRNEVAAMESALGMATFREAYPEVLSPSEIRRETGFSGSMYYNYSQPDDYANGRYRPFFETEQDHQEIRGAARFLAGLDEMALCVLSNIRNYTIGEGAEVQVQARDDSAKQLAAEVQAFIDEFLDLNDYTDEGESDALMSGVIDGDHLLRLTPQGKAPARVEFIGGEHIGEPGNPREVEDYIGEVGLDWSFGVASTPNRPQDVRGYFVDWFGSGDWEYVSSDHSVFVKRNTPRMVKRGMSDFFAPRKLLDRSGKLHDNAVIGATIQASIAFIKEAASGQSPTSLVGSNLDQRLRSTATAFNGQGQSATVNTEAFLGGKVIDTSGKKFNYGPMGTPQGPLFLDNVYQSCARRVGSRWCMPEFMVSGDASNANYASTMAAESPFVRFILHEQSTRSRQDRKLYWRAIDLAARAGRFGGYTADDLYRAVLIEVEYPSPETRDPMQDEQVRDAQQSAGVLSPKTRANLSGLDYEQEIQNGARRSEASPMPQRTFESASVARERLRFSLVEGA